MRYPLKNRVTHTLRTRLVAIVAVFLVFSLCAFLFPNVTRTVSYDIARPVWYVADVVTRPFASIKQFFVFKSSLVNQNLTLQDKVAALELKEVDYDTLVTENQDLKAQLGRTSSATRVLANILSKPPRSPYDTFVIDAGSADGVALDDAVYVSDDVIIGTVTSVTSHTALVELFSTSGMRQEATQSRTGTSLEISGSGGANFKLDVPKETDILWGDTFVYPGSAAVMASVYYIDTDSQSSFKTIYLRIPGNVFSSTHVFVEKAR